MDWFLYDNGRRHERVKKMRCKPACIFMLIRTEAVSRSLFQNDVLKTFANFKRKHLYRSLILKNVGGFNSGTLTNKKFSSAFFKNF